MSHSALMSFAVPYAAFRATPYNGTWTRFLAWDVLLYSAYISNPPSGAAATACTPSPNAIERNLHCESNPTIRPFASLGLAMTIGKDGIGYVSLIPVSIGFAKVGDQGVHPYFSMFASVLNVTGRF
jgi:hypothetical protein